MRERLPHLEKRCGSADEFLPPCLLDELEETPDTADMSILACQRCEISLCQLQSDFDNLGLGQAVEPTEQACFQLIERLVLQELSSSAAAETDTALAETLGPYAIREVLGEGGMGRVYRATHTRLRKDVAIKVLSDKALVSPQAIARFEREMQAVGKVEHPNVVGAMDAGTIDGITYLTMDMLEGADCSQVCDAVPNMSVATACEIARQAAIGLQHAHEQGLIHRDVKPSNLMLTTNSLGEPTVKVMDLGLAVVGSDGAEHPLTDDGQLMGTLGFMAPEQATSDGEVDRAADVYALGSTLFRMLAGRIPYSGDTWRTPVQRLHGLLHDAAPSIASTRADLPDALVELVDQMLARDPNLRPRSMKEVTVRLAKFCEGHQLSQALQETSRTAPWSQSRSTIDFLATVDTDPADYEITRELDQKPKPARLHFAAQRWLLAAAAAVILCAGVIWLRMTDGSYLRIEADPTVNVDIELLADGKKVKTLRVGKDQKAFWCESGRYRIQLPANVADTFVVDGADVTIARGAKSVVTIRRVSAAARPAIKQPWDEPPIYPTAQRPYDLGFDAQLEDGPDGEGSGGNGWVGSDTDDVTGPSQLFTMLIGRGDLNAELFAGWKNATGEESSLEFIRSKATFEPLTEPDAFSFTFNIEKYFQSEGWGQLTIGLANEMTNLFGVGLMGQSNHILRYGVSDWSVFPKNDKTYGITHGYALQSDRLNADGKESVHLTYDGKGQVRIQVFSDPNGKGSVRYDSGLHSLSGANGSSLQKFSADRLFIANDQASGKGKRRIWLRIDDIKVSSAGKDRIAINFDRATDSFREATRQPTSSRKRTVVSTLSNDGVGSLRQAIENATPGTIIHFDSSLSGKVLRSSGKTYVIDKAVTIDGANLASPLTLNAQVSHILLTPIQRFSIPAQSNDFKRLVPRATHDLMPVDRRLR